MVIWFKGQGGEIYVVGLRGFGEGLDVMGGGVEMTGEVLV